MHDRTRAQEFAETTGTTAGSAHKTADATKAAAKVGGALAAILAGAAAVGVMRQDKGGDRTSTAGSTDRSPSSAYDASVGTDVRDYSARSDVTSERSSNVTPFVAGPLAAVLLPALGAGLFSAFSKAGIPKEHAERYAQALESGGIVVGVEARSGDEARVRGILAS